MRSYGRESRRDGENSEVDENSHKIWPWFWGLCQYAVFISVFTVIQVVLRPTEDMYQYNEVRSQEVGTVVAIFGLQNTKAGVTQTDREGRSLAIGNQIVIKPSMWYTFERNCRQTC